MGSSWGGLTGEEELRRDVISMVCAAGLKLKAHPDSRRDRYSDRGFPDLVIAGIGGVLYRELKDATDTASRDQLAWGAVLQASGQNWAIWRPADRDTGRIAVELAALTVAYDPATIGRPAT